MAHTKYYREEREELMNISFYTPKENTDISRGYGTAGYGVVTSLQKLGHYVPYNDPTVPLQICLGQPQQYVFHDGQYRIGYTPWESTELPNGWLRMMNDCDEIWATSDWVADVYDFAGVRPPIHVYHHGIDPVWQPVKREPGEVVKFLHVGEPALRKGGQIAVDAFRQAFDDRKDVHLTVKAQRTHWLRSFDDHGILTTPDKAYGNVTILDDQMTKAEMLALYTSHDVMVYPSYGEGFGFIPLQALATGMPVICTDQWAPYINYLGPMRLDSHRDRSVWSVHPGEVYYPNFQHLVNLYRQVAKGIGHYQSLYYTQAPRVIEDFDWLKVTENAFKHLTDK